MKKQSLLKVFVALFTVALLAIPGMVFAGTSNDVIKKNVENLWKPIKESQPHISAVDFKKVVDQKKNFILIDIRTQAEYDAAHIPGAIHVDRGLLEWVAPKKIKNPNETIYVYCRTGARGAFATKRLKDMGYPKVVNIYDAFKGWVLAGYPVYNRHGEFGLTPDSFEKKELNK